MIYDTRNQRDGYVGLPGVRKWKCSDDASVKLPRMHSLRDANRVWCTLDSATFFHRDPAKRSEEPGSRLWHSMKQLWSLCLVCETNERQGNKVAEHLSENLRGTKLWYLNTWIFSAGSREIKKRAIKLDRKVNPLTKNKEICFHVSFVSKSKNTERERERVK